MAKKTKTAYVCAECGYDSVKWLGKCPSCGCWNSFKEVRIDSSPASQDWTSGAAGGGDTRQFSQRSGLRMAVPQRLSDISTQEEPRIDMRDGELNRVLGGGMVTGSITLLGGEPGIGKSTLTLQTILNLKDRRVLYVSGEESASQIKMRAERLSGTREPGRTEPRNPGISESRMSGCPDVRTSDSLLILCETNLEKIFEAIKESRPEILVIDSIQTIATDTQESSAGSIVQVRECASMLQRYAKQSGSPVLLIGHITKEGTLAGPKILEHIVDTVIQFEGDQNHIYRILRCIKNRFGSTSELGIYEMRQDGLRQVSNPSELLLNEDHEGLSGVAISATIEGARPFLIETQALVSTAAYGTPQRSATGFDQRRLNMLLAVLEKRVGFKLAQKDVFVNIAGGMKITDPAMDLSIISAVLSSNVDTPIEPGVAICGEVGLSGEVRPVSHIEQRIAEAEKLGFNSIIIPYLNTKGNSLTKFNIEIIPVRKVEEALRALFG